MKHYLTSIAFLLLSTYVQLAAAPPAAWKIEALDLKPDAENGEGQLSAIVIGQAGGERVELSARIPMERICESFVTGDKLVLLGAAHNPQAVVIFDIRQRKPIDWFLCYSPRRVSDQLIVFVEFYFAHEAGGEPTDVVLVYDLAKSPLENRLKKTPGMTLPPDRSDDALVEVGVPVYPEWNARQRSYENIVTEPAAARHVLGQGGYVLVDASKLVFLASEGEEFPNVLNYLVVVNLTGGLDRSAYRGLTFRDPDSGNLAHILASQRSHGLRPCPPMPFACTSQKVTTEWTVLR
jgi:hypothetical protein